MGIVSRRMYLCILVSFSTIKKFVTSFFYDLRYTCQQYAVAVLQKRTRKKNPSLTLLGLSFCIIPQETERWKDFNLYRTGCLSIVLPQTHIQLLRELGVDVAGGYRYGMFCSDCARHTVLHQNAVSANRLCAQAS